MAMEIWIEGQRQKGNSAAVARGQALREEFGEVPLVQALSEGQSGSAASPRIELRSPLDQAIGECKSKPHTPELITAFNRVLWQQISEIAGVDVVVRVVAPDQRALIEKGEGKEKGVILLPLGFEGQNQRRLIGAAFKLVDNKYVPENWSMQEDNSVQNDIIHVGYRLVDVQIDAPNLRTNERQAKDLMKKGRPEQEAEGMNLSEYVLSGLYSKLMTGQYLDQGLTWSRLLSSSGGGRVVDAHFDPNGFLSVYSHLEPWYQHGILGVRFSSGVKSA